jgi:enoyl-CoA hydratase/carnithine racemase
MNTYATLDRDGGIATLTLSNPQRLNALPVQAHWQISDLFDLLAEDESVRVVIVRGEGKAFCAGYDLHDPLADGDPQLPSSGFAGLTWREDYPLPLIAAVEGVAFGGGFELALACDLIIASDTASFALPEPKVGWAALGGGVQRLPESIGMKRSLDIILTGRSVSAAEGLSLGFVNEVVASHQLQDAALVWARRILACAPLAIRCSKQVAYASLRQPDFSRRMDPYSYASALAMLNSEDAQEGRNAFSEKRMPRWKGR